MPIKIKIILTLLLSAFVFVCYLAFFPPKQEAQSHTEEIKVQGLIKDL